MFSAAEENFVVPHLESLGKIWSIFGEINGPKFSRTNKNYSLHDLILELIRPIPYVYSPRSSNASYASVTTRSL